MEVFSPGRIGFLMYTASCVAGLRDLNALGEDNVRKLLRVLRRHFHNRARFDPPGHLHTTLNPARVLTKGRKMHVQIFFAFGLHFACGVFGEGDHGAAGAAVYERFALFWENVF